MQIHVLVDDLYEAFARRMGPELSASARDLPRVLRLSPVAQPWSGVFVHEVSLGAPALMAEAMAGVSPSQTREGVLAHLLAVIDSYGTARIEDERIEASPHVFAVLTRARIERNLAMTRLYSRTAVAETDFRAADAMTIRALRHERSMLKSRAPVDFALYEHILLEKRCAGSVASLALARIAGFEARRCRAVRATLESASLGLGIYEDVVGWESDLQHGGTWVTCLMRGIKPPATSGTHATRGPSARNEVLGAGILERMLSRATTHMRRARRRAEALRAHRLAAWAAEREARFESLVAAEADDAGFAVRSHAASARRLG